MHHEYQNATQGIFYELVFNLKDQLQTKGLQLFNYDKRI